MLIKGELKVTVNDPSKKKLAIKIDTSKISKDTKPKPHPAFNKSAWKDGGVLLFKKDDKEFETKKSYQTIDYKKKVKGSFSPFTFQAWLNDTTLSLQVEFNAEQSWTRDLKNLKFSFSSGGSEPEVGDKENCTFKYNDDEDICVWTIPSLNEEVEEATIELEFPEEVKEEVVYPFSVDFEIPSPFTVLEIQGVRCLETEENVKFEQNFELSVDNFSVNN